MPVTDRQQTDRQANEEEHKW